MSDLISKKAVMEELLAIQDATYMSTCLTVDECKGKQWMIARAIDAVKDTPTVDAEPVRHGHWIIHVDELFPADSTQECSVCHGAEWLGIKHENYCPNCGAKMDEVTHEET